MFNWDVSKMELYNEEKNFNKSNPLFSCENIVSQQDKIDFVDKMNDNKLSYLLNLSKQLEQDKKNLPVDKHGNIKTVSLKSWLKRNDTRKLVDDFYKYGNFYLMGGWRITNLDSEECIDRCFHAQLKKCARMEYEYYCSHDDYIIAVRELTNTHISDFGLPLVYNSTYITCRDRKLTLDEVNTLLDMNREIIEHIERLSQNCTIK